MNHKAHEPGLIRNDVLIQVLPHPLHVGEHPRTVDDYDLVTSDTIKVNLARPEFWRRMKLDLVKSTSGLVAEIDITARCSPLGRYVVFYLPKEVEQAGFGHKMLVGLVR